MSRVTPILAHFTCDLCKTHDNWSQWLISELWLNLFWTCHRHRKSKRPVILRNVSHMRPMRITRTIKTRWKFKILINCGINQAVTYRWVDVFFFKTLLVTSKIFSCWPQLTAELMLRRLIGAKSLVSSLILVQWWVLWFTCVGDDW